MTPRAILEIHYRGAREPHVTEYDRLSDAAIAAHNQLRTRAGATRAVIRFGEVVTVSHDAGEAA